MPPVATFNIRAFDVERNQLDDVIDVRVFELPGEKTVAHKFGLEGKKTVKVTRLAPGRDYGIQVFPLRHRPVAVVQRAPDTATPANVHVFCPVHPLRVTRPRFPEFSALPADLTVVLDRSTLEREADMPSPPSRRATSSGHQLYDGLDDTARAGLLNLYAKMKNTIVGGLDTWSFVNDLYRVRGDRIFANVQRSFRDQVRSAAAAQVFEKVSGSLHTPPPGFEHADSFKHQAFQAGILQLTFFASAVPPLEFKVDADIDDAGGIGHVFQVLRNFLTSGETHPYDIHEILLFHQLIAPGYDLPTT
jgi:hypothetical protein